MINSKTEIIGLIGYPVEHSLSPLLHNYIIKNKNLNYVYTAFSIKPFLLAEGIKGLKALGIKGVNVTIPHKEEVIPYLDEIDMWAKEIGAVNTIVNQNDKLIGYNTDAAGFKEMLKDANLSFENKSIIIVGAGGAARAVGAVFSQEKVADITLLNRSYKKAELLKEYWRKKNDSKLSIFLLKEIYSDENDHFKEIFRKADIIVDTTPVGMAPDSEVEAVIPAKYLHKNHLVIDLVYNPTETILLREARKKGASTLNGLTMLVYQAVSSFKLWTGEEADIDDCLKYLREIVK